MTGLLDQPNAGRDPFGKKKLSLIDRFGVWLSQRAIRKHLPTKTDLDVLELGCGFRAENLIALLPRVRSVVGIDFQISEEIKHLSQTEFFEGAIETSMTRLKPEAFDAILLISVLEHLPDPLTVLRDCRSCLRPGGILLVNVPTWRGKIFLEYAAFRLGVSPKGEMDDHKMYYDHRDLWPLMVKAGFLPSRIHMNYHKFGLNLFAEASK